MSRSSGIYFRGRDLWVHTEGLQVWLALLIEAGSLLEARDEPWFQDLIKNWRVQATVADLGCTLEDSWTDEQLGVIVGLARRTRRELEDPGVESQLLRPEWSVLDDLPVAGGVGPLHLHDRINEVADAFIRLLEGALPPDPHEGWWGVGWGRGQWVTIPRRRKA